MKFRKKPVVIEATQWFEVGDHPAVIINPVTQEATEFNGCRTVAVGAYIRTLEGLLHVTAGDWIVTGVKGEHYPCKPDIFAATYEPVEET